MLRIVLRYLWHNAFMAGVLLYFLVSIILKKAFNLDILIPCIWKKFFHFECFGCGLTTSCIYLISCDIEEAYQSNALIFILLPACVFYLYKDFIKFKNQ